MSRLMLSRWICTAALACAGFVGSVDANAQGYQREQVRLIEQEYARQNQGRAISDDQLEYYLDQANSGWTMDQISRDIEGSRRGSGDSVWSPRDGWVADAVICSSNNNRYRECAAPFHGQAVLSQQYSQAACIEGTSWGQKAGAVWVDGGCRARFAMVQEHHAGMAHAPRNNAAIVCESIRGGYRECGTGNSGRVEVISVLSNNAECIENRSWGQRPGTVWVTRGCRAQFATSTHAAVRDDGRWNTGYAVTCTSNRNNRAICEWDRRYGQPRLGQTLSRNACIEGSSWGYDGRGGLWVNAGCRASFVSQRSGFDDRDHR